MPALADPPAARVRRPAPTVAPGPPAPAVPDSFLWTDTPTDCVTLRGVSWDTYLSLSDEAENGKVRFTFEHVAGPAGGILEIEMASEFPHENVADLFLLLVAAYLERRGVDYEPAGAMHLRRPGVRGGQADRTFFLGPKAAAARGGFPPGGGPPPDLVIEIVFGNPVSARKRAVYADLGVPEIWVWRDDTLTAQRLTDAGIYETVSDSVELPGFPLDAARDLLNRRGELPKPALLAAFRRAVGGG